MSPCQCQQLDVSRSTATSAWRELKQDLDKDVTGHSLASAIDAFSRLLPPFTRHHSCPPVDAHAT
eukprot:748107-Hanusia_phi.AAC.2